MPLRRWAITASSTQFGENTIIRKAILDKNCRVGANVQIVNERNVQEADGENHFIRDGIVIVPKDAIVPDGTVI